MCLYDVVLVVAHSSSSFRQRSILAAPSSGSPHSGRRSSGFSRRCRIRNVHVDMQLREVAVYRELSNRLMMIISVFYGRPKYSIMLTNSYSVGFKLRRGDETHGACRLLAVSTRRRSEKVEESALRTDIDNCSNKTKL